MQVNLLREGAKFKPFTIELTFNSIAEVKIFYAFSAAIAGSEGNDGERALANFVNEYLCGNNGVTFSLYEANEVLQSNGMDELYNIFKKKLAPYFEEGI